VVAGGDDDPQCNEDPLVSLETFVATFSLMDVSDGSNITYNLLSDSKRVSLQNCAEDTHSVTIQVFSCASVIPSTLPSSKSLVASTTPTPTPEKTKATPTPQSISKAECVGCAVTYQQFTFDKDTAKTDTTIHFQTGGTGVVGGSLTVKANTFSAGMNKQSSVLLSL